MQVRVVVRGSPYRAVAVGAVGKVISRKYVGTKIEQWRILFPGGAKWTFYPDELEVLNAHKEDELVASSGSHR